MPKCPTCGKITITPLKEWDYAGFHVKLLNCKTCKKKFRTYYYKGKFSHTILSKPAGVPKKKTAIIEYLKVHDNATNQEIADALHFPIEDVLKELLKLEKLDLIVRHDSIEKSIKV